MEGNKGGRTTDNVTRGGTLFSEAVGGSSARQQKSLLAERCCAEGGGGGELGNKKAVKRQNDA